MKEINFEEALDIALTQRQIDRASGRKMKKPTRREVEEAFIETFELVGGIPRLAIWASKEGNYGEFLKLYARLIPKEVAEEAGQVFIYESNVPASPLNKAPVLTKIDDAEVGDDTSAE
jgi:hypothetical protein